MKYNIAENSYIKSNISLGNKNITLTQLLSMLRSTSANIAIANPDIVVIDMDLGERTNVTEFRYYFSSSSDPGAVASGITFYAKNNDFESFSQIDIYTALAYYYALTSGTLYAPRYLRVVHTVSGTSISGAINGLQVLTDDEVVDFGEDGSREEENFNMSLRFNPNDIREVQVFNNNYKTADAYITIEPQNSIVDNLVSIATTSGGPWYSLYDASSLLLGTALSWTYGTFDNNTYLYENSLRLYDGTTSGTYTTRVFNKAEGENQTKLLANYIYPVVSSGIVFSDSFDTGTGPQWLVTAGTITYTSYYLTISTSSPSTASVRTKNEIVYSHDWEVTMKIMWSQQPNTPDYYAFFYPYIKSTNEYVGLRICSTVDYKSIRFYMNGIIKHTLTKYDALNDRHVWYWFKTKRQYNNLSYKLWSDGTSEPDWDWSGPIANTDLPSFTGNIQLTGYYAVYYNPGYCRMDDVTVVSNCSSHGETDLMLAIDPFDTEETIQIRSSNIKPIDDSSYMKPINTGADIVINVYDHRTDALTQQSIRLLDPYYVHDFGYYICPDPTVDVVWGFLPYIYGVDRYKYMRLFRWDRVTNTITYANITLATIYTVHGYATDGAVCFWTFIHRNENTAGYYLIRYNSALAITASIYDASVKFIYAMDLDKTDRNLWCNNTLAGQILKLNSTGDPLISIDGGDLVYGLCGAPNGGCYVIRESKLVHYDVLGNLVASYTSGINTTTRKVNLDIDYNDCFWVLENTNVVKNMNFDGHINIELPFILVGSIRSVAGGLWVECLDIYKWKFISREGGIVTKEMSCRWSPTTATYAAFNETSKPGFYSRGYSEEVPDVRFPLPADTRWAAIPWRKVSLHSYALSNEIYNQVRFNLRPSSAGVTPVLNSVYKQTAIKLDDIGANDYKLTYVKIDISSLSENQLGDYESNLNVWWYVPE